VVKIVHTDIHTDEGIQIRYLNTKKS